MIWDVTDLDVYNRSMKALEFIYLLSKQIPQSHFKLRSQIDSAAEGVPAQIAEGFAKRRSAKEFKRFLEIAMGSSDEVITHARAVKILAMHYSKIDKDLCDKVVSEYKIISKQINRLRNNWIDYRSKSSD